MPDNEKVYGEVCGCDNVHFAMVSKDSKEEYKAETPEYLAPSAEITFDYAETLTPRHYDNVAFFMEVDDDDTKISIILSGVPNDKAARLLGLPYDQNSGILVETTPNPPWVALSGRMNIAGGNHMFFQYLKGKFTRSTKKANTKGSGTTYNTTDLVYTAAKTIHPWQLDENRVEGARGVTGATYDTNFKSADSWFEKVQTPIETSAVAAQTDAGNGDDEEN